MPNGRRRTDQQEQFEGVEGIEDVPHHHVGLERIISQLDDRDAETRYREEAADNAVGVNMANGDSERVVVAWEQDDPENPYNWSAARKTYILVTTVLAVLNSTMGSALPSNAVAYMAAEWKVTSTEQKVLPMSTFLVGYILGPLVWAPCSEQFGRRYITTAAFCVFMVWTMACALAPNWPAFLVFRLFTGVFASAPLAIIAGTLADVFGDARARGCAMAFFMAATLYGPLIAPIVSGYCATTIGWRWTFWIALMYAGASFVPLLFVPETFAPVLLAQRAARLRRADPKAHARLVAPHELERRSLRDLAVVVLTRPLRMLASELIVTCACVYLSLVYAIFYMTFQAFPLIFEGLYAFSPGVDGLIFLAVGAGAAVAIPIFYGYDAFLARATARDVPWTRREEYRRLPLACLGGPMFVISLFWLGWSARSSVSFISPMLAGIPFGMGFMLSFMSLINYVTDAYEIFAASANAALSCCRSVLATVLPLATAPMFARLSIPGACSLLGGLSLLMCPIPFVFLWKGDQIRAGSRFCIALQERKLEMERQMDAQRMRQENRDEKSESV